MTESVSEVVSEKALFSRLFGDADRCFPGNDAISRRIGTLCSLSKDDRVLDVGPWRGPTARLLARERNCRVTCLEQDETALKGLNEAARRDGVENLIDTWQAAFLEMEPPLEGYQTVILEIGVRCDAKELEEMIEQARRFLQPNGRLAITASVKVGRVMPVAVQEFYESRGESLKYPGEIAEAIERKGFEPLAIEAYAETALDEWYRLLEDRLNNSPSPGEGGAEKLRKEIDIFRREGGRSCTSIVLCVARRREDDEMPLSPCVE